MAAKQAFSGRTRNGGRIHGDTLMPAPAEPIPPRLTRARLLVWVLAGLTFLVAWQVWAITRQFFPALG